MRIVRMEHARSHLGPYQHQEVQSHVCHCYDPQQHPSPWDDGINGVQGTTTFRSYSYSGYRFGFRTLQELLDWFGHTVLEALFGQDFHVVEYEVEPEWVMLGGKQVAFRWEMSRVMNSSVEGA